MTNIITKKQIGLLHTAKAKLGLSEEDYRSLLYQHGADSTKDLKQTSFKKLLKIMNRLGFETRGPSAAAPVSYTHLRAHET